jgi:hypothetical protein
MQEPEELSDGIVLGLAEVVVAAGQRGRDIDAESASGPDRSRDPARGHAGALFGAEAREELIEVVDDLHAGAA